MGGAFRVRNIVIQDGADKRFIANLMNFVQDTAEKDAMEPKKYVLMTDIARLPV